MVKSQQNRIELVTRPGPCSGFFEGKDPLKCDPTGLREETLVHIGKRFGAGPPNAEDFKIHRGLQRVLAARSQV